MQYSITFGIELGATEGIAANKDWKPGLM